MTFYWWDQALAIAGRRASLTGRRHRVNRLANGLWMVVEVGA